MNTTLSLMVFPQQTSFRTPAGKAYLVVYRDWTPGDSSTGGGKTSCQVVPGVAMLGHGQGNFAATR
jgi:hypothetical protein